MSSIKKVYQYIFPKKIRAQFHVILWHIKSFFIIGNNVSCNCCNKNYSKFFDYGDYQKRLNALCPKCLSLERTRLLWLFLKNSNYIKNTSILQFSPFKIIEKQLQVIDGVAYISGDIDPMLAMKKIDITNIDFKNSSFDVVLCSHVLSVVKEDLKAIKELFRVLKSGGTLILQEHIFENFDDTFEDLSISTDEERFKTYGKHYLQRCYGNDFTQRFLKEGFTVEIFDPIKELSEEIIKKHGLQNSGVIHLFHKK